ncbi:MAG: ABC transporter ATP-binding protein [Nitriliruptoraceae bacterium]
MPAVTLSGIGHSYDGRREVLSDIDLQLEKGEVTAVVGPSGSGKSTLLSIVGGLIEPSQGWIRLGDGPRCRALRSLAYRRSVGWVFQTTNALGHRNVLDNVALPLRMRGQTEAVAMQRASSLSERFGLASVAEARAADLSGGELQRLCIARALATDPDVIVADEPTGQLDSATTDDIGQALLTAAAAGACVLIATHDAQLAGFADEQYHLAGGRLSRR